MLSVLIETHNDEEGLARTLAALVVGVVEGAVREVIVCDRGSADQTHRVAEHAGCHFLPEGGIAAGIREAKGEWLLLLEPGARLDGNWIEAVLDHVAHSTRPARFVRSKNSRQPFFARVLYGRRPLRDGLVITKRQALSLARGEGSAAAIARAAAARRLAAGIVVAPPRRR
ncbi:MAG TPA: glycosyltransferase [Rhizobiales bacterium]|nr:glycosyltransferase [Hyphomicrobiales bacterium]